MFFNKAKCFTSQCFSFETLNITPRKYICLSEAVILSATCNFVATIAALCDKHATSSQKCDYNIYILTHVVDFVPW